MQLDALAVEGQYQTMYLGDEILAAGFGLYVKRPTLLEWLRQLQFRSTAC